MAAISTYFADLLLDILANTSFVSAPYVQLHTGDPGVAGTTNVATNNSRALIQWAVAAAKSKATNADISWASVPASETYSYISIWDAGSGGNFLWAGALVAPVAVTVGQTFTIASGTLTAGLT